ncbi:MAG: phosphatidylserine/phosphatidylglycerophosphate/cardiolipin synthase family protein [Candidatus Woesebacteria bacterium]|nr:phosphatidylserine/phosphatidylglycerophosphate/cardiolipin synthase family protein [Candidatus Woesebacteria bacterium]
MYYKFFTNSQKSWQAMFEAISLAQKSIYFEMYIFQDDIIDFDFISLLKEKAKAKLKVKMILDSFGSADLSKKMILELKEAGVELFFLSYFFHRAHRKILIVDEEVAFVGGVNFHQSARNWNDLVVKLRGKIMPYVLRSFAKAYEKCGGRDVSILRHKKNKKIITNEMSSWLIEHSPMWKKSSFKKIYQKKINHAEKNIFLVTPYFMPRRWLIALFHQAILRGLRVEVLVPQFTDYYFIDRINYVFMSKLSKLGVNIYLAKEMNHAKLMIIDEREGMVGSQNLDYVSFDLNSELGIFFDEPKTVKKLVEIFESWKKNAILFDSKIQKPNFLDYLLSPIISIFNKIL